MDFLVKPTIFFNVLYVLVIINHSTRKIEHIAVTTNPDSAWVKQQLRNATPYDHKPKYLIHDNDPVFTSYETKSFLASSGIKPVKITRESPWQNAYAERVLVTLFSIRIPII